MKKTNLLTAVTLCTVLAFTSCSKSDTIECHPCHIAQDRIDENGIVIGENEFDIPSPNPNGFCGDALEELEVNGYQLQDTLYADVTLDILLPGFYTDIHCEEHAD